MDLISAYGILVVPSILLSVSHMLAVVYFSFCSVVSCSWGSFKCYIWKCNRVDNLNICTEKWNDSGCAALFAGLNFVKYATGAWMCILKWWDCFS